MRKIIDLISPEKISLVVLTDSDPDACANLPIVEDLIANPDLLIAAHSNSLKQIRHLGVQSNFYAVNQQDYCYTLKSGRQLSFHPTLYLHSPGSIATYDATSQSLFSGDIFAGDQADWSLFDNMNFPRNLDVFHQTYMPSNQVLMFGLKTIESLNIKRILPQHGSIIEGGNVVRAFAHLSILDCGIDFLGE
jgi:flavorubredoxin